MWNGLWKQWIDENPGATEGQIFEHANWMVGWRFDLQQFF
jgi:hypothetical protein